MTDSESIKKRVYHFVKVLGSNPNRFQESIGVSGTYLKTVKNIGADKISKILEKYPQINAEWLLLGKGEMMKIEGGVIADNKGNINTGSVGGHNLNISGSDYEKIIEKDRIELIRQGAESKANLQEVNSLKAEIARLEAIIKSKDETIAAKDETIAILKNK